MKKLLSISLLIVFLGVGVASLWYFGFLGGERSLLRMVKKDQNLLSLYNTAVAKEKLIETNSDEQGLYIDAGLAWKSVAEQSIGDKNRKPFFEKSLAVYNRGVEKFGQKNILFLYNAGQVAMSLENYALAESLFKQAIQVAPADETGYRALADLYTYKLNKPSEEIIAMLNDGISKMFNPAPLISTRANYYMRINDNVSALKDFEQLTQIYPNNNGFKVLVEELKAKIASSK